MLTGGESIAILTDNVIAFTTPNSVHKQSDCVVKCGVWEITMKQCDITLTLIGI